MKTRILSTLLALVMMLTLATFTQSSALASAQDEEAVTISFVTIAGTQNVSENSAVQQYLEQKYNVKLMPVRIASENMLEQLGLLIATGEMPDVMPRTNYIDDLLKHGAIGAVKKDWVAQYAPNIYAKLEELSATYGIDGWEMVARDGEYYALPTTYLGGITMGYGTNWRLDLLETLGYSAPPSTIGEAEEVFAAFKAAYPDKYVMSARTRDAHYQMFATTFNAIAGCIPAQAYYKDGEILRSDIMPEMRKALEKLAEWYQLGYIDPEFITNDSATYDGLFYSGQILMYDYGYIDYAVGYDDNIPTYFEKLSAEIGQPEAKYAYTPGIANEEGIYAWQGFRPYGGATMFSAAMAADEKKMAKYLEMLDGCTYTLEDSLFIIYGEEGVRWEYDNAGTPQYLDKGFDTTEAREKYGNNNAFYFGFIDGSVASGPFANVFSNSLQLDASNKVRDRFKDNFDLYFGANVLPVPSDVVNSYTDDIEKMYEEVFDSIITGRKDITYFDEFVKRWLSAGGQAYLDAMNELNLKFFN